MHIPHDQFIVMIYKNNLIKASLFSAFLTMHFAAIAQSGESLGAGSFGCGEWAKTRAEQSRKPTFETILGEAMYVSWSQGFLNGMSFSNLMANRKVPRVPNAETIRLFLDKHCRDNPLDTLLEANVRLMNEVMKRE